MSNPFYGNYDLNVGNKVTTMMMTVKTAKIPESNDGVQARQFSLVKSGTFS